MGIPCLGRFALCSDADGDIVGEVAARPVIEIDDSFSPQVGERHLARRHRRHRPAARRSSCPPNADPERRALLAISRSPARAHYRVAVRPHSANLPPGTTDRCRTIGASRGRRRPRAGWPSGRRRRGDALAAGARGSSPPRMAFSKLVIEVSRPARGPPPNPPSSSPATAHSRLPSRFPGSGIASIKRFTWFNATRRPSRLRSSGPSVSVKMLHAPGVGTWCRSGEPLRSPGYIAGGSVGEWP